jgi:hypothetical protein
VVKFHQKGDAYDVVSLGWCGLIEAGARFNEIPRKIEDPSLQAPLALGTIVVVDKTGYPFISGVLPVGASEDQDAPNIPNLGVDAGPDDTELGTSASYGRPVAKGIMAGDWLRKSPDGNYVAVLRKGINWLFANKQTQIFMSRIGDFIGIYSKEFIHRSGIGELRIGQQDGEGFLQFDAGFDLLNEVAYKATKYPFTVGLGKAAKKIGGQDCIACLTIKNPDDKKPVSGIYFTNAGRIKFLAHAGYEFLMANKGPHDEEIGGDKRTRIAGNRAQRVGGARFQTIEQGDSTTVGSNKDTTIGNDENKTVQRNAYKTVMGNVSMQIRGGDAAPELPTTKGYEMQILNNSYVVEVGSKKAGSLQSLPLEMGFYMHNGELIIGENPLVPATLCNISMHVNKPLSGGGGIHLGGHLKSPTTNAPVLHNEAAKWFASLITWLDTHTHPTAWGPSGVPISPSTSVLTSDIPKMRSLYVGIKA